MNGMKCLNCGDVFLSQEEFPGQVYSFCSLKCEAEITLSLEINKARCPEHYDEYYNWLKTKPKAAEITAHDLVHPNPLVRKRAEYEIKK